MEDYFQIGIITSTHGLHGEVKVYPTTDDVRRFKRLKEVIAAAGGEKQEKAPDTGRLLEVEGVKFFKKFAILKFAGIDTVEEAEKYRRSSLFVTRENAVRLGRDEYFIADLMGLSVRNEEGAPIGVLKDVLQTGANDVYVIRLDTGKEILLPAIKQCVLEVDVQEGFVRVHLLDGLEEL